MSLHKFAEQVASKGRGDDSLLVHMTPDEVQRLQKFAEANGRTLTINPETGLPEAGFLSDLFKAVAPIALGAFLGPAGLGMSSMMAGVATGGITTLATGSLSRGLMAGLGAYGGAGLGESLMTAGGGMSAANAATTAQQQLSGANLALGEAMPAQAAEQFTKDAVTRMTPSGAVSAGFNKAIASPGAALDFAKGNLGNLAYAAAPIMAGAMVPTTTKLGDPKDTGYIRQFDYNINPDTGRPDPLYGMRAMTPVKASEFKDKTFQGQRDLFRQQNPNPYDIGIGSLNQPPLQQPAQMNTGGIVALARGGVAHFEEGGGVSYDYGLGGGGDSNYSVREDGSIDYFANQLAPDVFAPVVAAPVAAAPVVNTGGGLAALNTAATNTGANTNLNFNSGVELADNALSAGAKYAAANKVDIGANVNKFIQDNPFATATDINTALTKAGLTQADVNPFLTANTNISDATRYALSHASEMPGAGGLAGMQANIMKAFATPGLTQTQIDTEQKKYGISNADIQSPLAHGYQVADTDTAKATNYLRSNPDVQAWLNSAEGKDYIKKHPEFDANDIAYTHYKRYGEKEGRKWEEAAKKPPIVCGPGYRLNAAGTACELIPIIKDVPPLPDPFVNVTPTGFYGNNTGNPLTSTPGDIIRNPDGTSTVVPNIPGRPTGGFTGIQQLKDAYTAGGGSLGYTAKAPKTAAEHNAMYNKLTDDSLDAYNFLMGKGKNLTQRKAETRDRPVMQRYDEAVLGRKIPRATKPGTTTTKTVTGVPGQPQTYFNEAEYLAANPDVAAELKTGKSASGQPTRFTSGYEHYLMYGKAGGRAFTGDYEGYTTALALANAARESGGDGPTGPSGGGNPNSISGFTPAPPNDSIPDVSMSPVSTVAPPAAPPGDDGDSAGDDAVGGYYSRGKLNYRSKNMAAGGYAMGGGLGSLGSYSDGGRLLRGPGDGVSDSIPATIGAKRQPARLADGEFVIPARIVSELGNGSTDAGAKKLYAMMDRVQRARGKTTGKNKVAANSRADKYLPA